MLWALTFCLSYDHRLHHFIVFSRYEYLYCQILSIFVLPDLTSNADRRYNGLTAPNITCLVVDNDMAGVELSYPYNDGTLSALTDYNTKINATTLYAEITEGTIEASSRSGMPYGVRLRTRPFGTVVVAVSHTHTSHRWLDANQTDGYTVTVTSLTFTTDNWDTQQPVYVFVPNDDIARADPSFTVTLTHDVSSTSGGGGWSGGAYSGDPAYDRLDFSNQPEVALTVYEDDVAGIYQSATLLSLGVMYDGQPLFVDDYSFALTSQPTHAVKVHLRVGLRDNPRVNSNQTHLSARDFVFSRTDWAVERHVYVNATSSLTDLSDRNEYLFYEITSSDPVYGTSTRNGVAAFNNGLGPRLAVKVVVSADGAPPPKLISTWFLDTGAGAELIFDRATNRAGLSATFPCTALMFGPAVDAYGDGSNCRWTSSAVLRVKLPSDATVVSGDTFYLKNGLLKNSFASSTLYATNVTDRFFTPPTAVAPATVLSAPSTIGLCDDLLVDGSLTSGSGGRALKMTWNVTFPGLSSNVSTANMTAVVREATRTDALFINFEKSVFPNAPAVTMVFRVYAKNWLGNYDVTSLTVKKGNNDPPVVRILGYGSSVASFAADSLTLNAAATMPACNPGNIPLGFQWAEPSGLLTSDEVARVATATPKKIKIPAGLLTALNVYTFRVTAWVPGAHLVNTTAEITVTAKASDLFAAVSGGSFRMQSRNDELALDGSASFDPDDLTSTSHLTYAWACALSSSRSIVTTPAQSSCTTTSGAALALDTASETTIAASELSSGTYAFTLWVYSLADGRNSSATAVVKLAALEVPKLSIRPLSVAKVNPNPGSFVQLRGTLVSDPAKFEGGLTYLWTKTDGDDPSSDSIYATVFAVAPSRLNTVLQLGALTEGQTYSFRLTATVAELVDDAANATTGFSELSVVVNSPPSSGSFKALPASGVALTTSFTLTCTSWVDDASDLPLTYAFFAAPGMSAAKSLVAITSEQSLVAASTATSYTTLLPEGGSSGNVSLVVYIRDRFGGSTRVSTAVGVGSLADSFSSIFGRRRRQRRGLLTTDDDDGTSDEFSGFMQNLTNGLMTDAALAGDSERMVANAASVASVANSEGGAALMSQEAQTSLVGGLVGSMATASTTIDVSAESADLMFGSLGSISNGNADRLDEAAQVRDSLCEHVCCLALDKQWIHGIS